MFQNTGAHEFQNLNFTAMIGISTEQSDFLNCSFTGCDCLDVHFANALENCVFEDCNLSLTCFSEARLQDVKFLRCKLMGVDFTSVNPLGLTLKFEECLIRSCNFNFLPLPKTAFLNSEIIETDFAGTDLREAKFTGSTFQSVTFHNTNLSKADFSTARGYIINPLTNNVKNAVFSLPEAVSLLSGLGIKLK